MFKSGCVDICTHSSITDMILASWNGGKIPGFPALFACSCMSANAGKVVKAQLEKQEMEIVF